MLNNIQVTLQGVDDILNTSEVISEALLKFNDTYKAVEYESFIEEYNYIGNGHLLVVESLIENGLNTQAKIYLKEYLKTIDDIEELFVPLAVGMEDFESSMSFEEWLNDLGIDIKEIK